MCAIILSMRESTLILGCVVIFQGRQLVWQPGVLMFRTGSTGPSHQRLKRSPVDLLVQPCKTLLAGSTATAGRKYSNSWREVQQQHHHKVLCQGNASGMHVIGIHWCACGWLGYPFEVIGSHHICTSDPWSTPMFMILKPQDHNQRHQLTQHKPNGTHDVHSFAVCCLQCYLLSVSCIVLRIE